MTNHGPGAGVDARTVIKTDLIMFRALASDLHPKRCSDVRNWLRQAWALIENHLPNAIEDLQELVRIKAGDEDSYVAWCRYTKNTVVTCDSDAPGAFKVYRHQEAKLAAGVGNE